MRQKVIHKKIIQKKTIQISLLMLLLTPLLAIGKSYHFNKIVDAKGKSITLVDKVIKDEVGFLWVLDYATLYRFDGYRYDRIASELMSTAMLLDSKKRLWCSDEYSLMLFDTQNNQIKVYKQLSASGEDFSYQNVRYVGEMPGGEILVGTDEGLSFYLEDKDAFANYTFKTPASKDGKIFQVNSLSPLNREELLVGTNKGVYRLNWEKQKNAANHVLLLNQPVLEHVKIKSITKIAEKKYIFATFGGFYYYDADNNTLELYQRDRDKIDTLSDNNINSVLSVSETEIWIATQLGLDIFNPQTRKIGNARGDESIPRNENINHLHKAGNQVLIAAQSGVYSYTLPEENQPTIEKRTSYPIPEYETIKNVWSIHQSPTHGLLLGTYGLGLFSVNRNGDTERFTYSDNDTSGLSGNNVSVIYEDSESGELAYHFNIATPPWESWWAYFTYLVTAVFLLFCFSKMY